MAHESCLCFGKFAGQKGDEVPRVVHALCIPEQVLQVPYIGFQLGLPGLGVLGVGGTRCFHWGGWLGSLLGVKGE